MMKTFKFDEFAVERLFRAELNALLSVGMCVRPKSLEQIPINTRVALSVVVTDKLVGQNNADCISLVMRQAANGLAGEVANSRGFTSPELIAAPLEFDYVRGDFDTGAGKIEAGTKVRITTRITRV